MACEFCRIKDGIPTLGYCPKCGAAGTYTLMSTVCAQLKDGDHARLLDPQPPVKEPKRKPKHKPIIDSIRYTYRGARITLLRLDDMVPEGHRKPVTMWSASAIENELWVGSVRGTTRKVVMDDVLAVIDRMKDGKRC